MENGKLQRRQKALEQWAQEHPEEVRRLRERAKALAEFLNSSEWDAFWQPAKAAILQGDETGIRAWAEGQIGHKPDSILGVHLTAKVLGDVTPHETWELVDGRGEKLASKAKSEANAIEAAAFAKKSKKYPRMKRILSEYPDWIREIERAAWEAREQSPSDDSLAMSAIEWRIERDNRWRGLKGAPRLKSVPTLADLRSQVNAAKATLANGDLGAQEHAEATRALWEAEERLDQRRELTRMASFDDLAETSRCRRAEADFENILDHLFLAHYASGENSAGLSSQEREVFELAIALGNQEIAHKVGRPKNQVAQEKARAIKKVRKDAGL